MSGPLCQRIDEIDRMLFDASVMALSKDVARADVDRKITDARIALDKLRSRVE